VFFGFVFFSFLLPLSIAEFTGIGRANSPWMANLALCARMAHQGGLVGNSDEFRHPERFSGQTRWDGILLVTFLLLLTKFVRNKFERALLGLQGE
jgi:hypothetical protein